MLASVNIVNNWAHGDNVDSVRIVYSVGKCEHCWHCAKSSACRGYTVCYHGITDVITKGTLAYKDTYTKGNQQLVERDSWADYRDVVAEYKATVGGQWGDWDEMTRLVDKVRIRSKGDEWYFLSCDFDNTWDVYEKKEDFYSALPVIIHGSVREEVTREFTVICNVLYDMGCKPSSPLTKLVYKLYSAFGFSLYRLVDRCKHDPALVGSLVSKLKSPAQRLGLLFHLYQPDMRYGGIANKKTGAIQWYWGAYNNHTPVSANLNHISSYSTIIRDDDKVGHYDILDNHFVLDDDLLDWIINHDFTTDNMNTWKQLNDELKQAERRVKRDNNNLIIQLVRDVFREGDQARIRNLASELKIVNKSRNGINPNASLAWYNAHSNLPSSVLAEEMLTI